MLRYVLPILFIFFFGKLAGNPRVPSHMEFAGIKLSITDAARKQIQTDVDALHRNQTYLKRKVNKVDLYFPIIERVFRSENLPEDFKYLAIQESALIADAVSSSNAVGFWQFKEVSAKEVGLRVDRYIDERMHITASTHAAAKYLKKNNFFFDNWVYALLAYNTGPGGAEQHVDKKYMGAHKMEINKRTHWYVKKFLAHKIAFENEINKNYAPALKLYEYEKTQNKSLREISDYFEIDQKSIEDYNKWLRRGRIPADKTYLAIIPVGTDNLVAQNLLEPTETTNTSRPKTRLVLQNSYKPISDFDFQQNQQYPKVNNNSPKKVTINGIPGFIASDLDDINSISVGHAIAIDKFLKYNDMTSSDKIEAGQVYYLKAKKSKAKIHYHIVQPGENAWSISQKYGLKIKKLLTKNRMREEKELSPGMVMWLRFIRPKDEPIEYREINAQNVVVKSFPNEIEYPQKLLQPIEIQEEATTQSYSPPEFQEENTDFLFEEVDEETQYINENSYVEISNQEEALPEENMEEITPRTQEKSVKKEEIYHIVKSGETLFSISRTYGITIGELRQWNSIDDLDVLNVGQRLRIENASNPIKNTASPHITNSEFETYRVRANDTLYGIARQYNISIKELMDINDKDDFTIKEGEVIKIRRLK